MRISIIFVLLFIATMACAQKRGAEGGFISDNDLYTSTVNDKYYTNGLELFYRYLNGNTKGKVAKKVTEFRIGQYVYNPRTRKADNALVNDRPFAGYLFVEAGRNIFYRNESVLKSNLQLGYVGPNALGDEMQKAFHHVFGYKRVDGWQHQIKNALAIQANFLYSKKILPAGVNTKFDTHIQTEINAGTIWNSVSVGILSRASLKNLLLPVYNSNLHGASLNADPQVYKDESELYFYFAPILAYQFYDATIQGSLFNGNSPVTRDLIPLRFQAEAGFKYRKNNWNLSYSFLYRGQEVDYPRNEGYFYGSIVIGHMLN